MKGWSFYMFCLQWVTHLDTPFSGFVYSLFILAWLSSCCTTLCSVKLYCPVGAFWVLVSKGAACVASILWAMKIIVLLTDVPCIFHVRAWLCKQWVKSFFSCLVVSLPPSPKSSTAFSASSPTPPLRSPHTHPSTPLSLKSMNSILLGLMEFVAKVRRMHFNHGRS